MADNYWRNVFKDAWEKTKRPLGWSREKVSSTAVTVIAAFVAGGVGAVFNVVLASIGVLIALAVVGLGLFVWGIIETQAEMYRKIEEVSRLRIESLENAINQERRPAPDYEKWRHRANMNLRTAAQLWTGERPGMKLVGDAKETYEMLHGAVESGELALELDPAIDPRMQRTARAMKQKNPSADTVVTRTALKAFAARNGYDPEFLKD